jgi:hypothetical protein
MNTSSTMTMQRFQAIVLLVLINSGWAAEPGASQTGGAGEVPCPATLGVKVDTNILSASSEARLVVVLKNVSTNTIFWVEKNPPINNLIVTINDNSGRNYNPTPPAQPARTKHRQLEPGASHEWSIPLRASTSIPAGDYELSVTYDFIMLPGETLKTWKPQSNRVPVHVK